MSYAYVYTCTHKCAHAHTLYTASLLLKLVNSSENILTSEASDKSL